MRCQYAGRRRRSGMETSNVYVPLRQHAPHSAAPLPRLFIWRHPGTESLYYAPSRRQLELLRVIQRRGWLLVPCRALPLLERCCSCCFRKRSGGAGGFRCYLLYAKYIMYAARNLFVLSRRISARTARASLVPMSSLTYPQYISLAMTDCVNTSDATIPRSTIQYPTSHIPRRGSTDMRPPQPEG